MGHQRRHRDQRTVPGREFLLSAPHFTKEDVIIELCKLGSKFPEGIPARSLLDCHHMRPFLTAVMFDQIPQP